jgi:hypothetical protein
MQPFQAWFKHLMPMGGECGGIAAGVQHLRNRCDVAFPNQQVDIAHGAFTPRVEGDGMQSRAFQ